MPEPVPNPPALSTDEVRLLVETGVDLCRAGDWSRGIYYLEQASSRPTRGIPLPPVYYSYYGRAVARDQERLREGLAYCEQAARDEFWNPEIWVNLSRARFISGNRRGAVSAVNEGLAIDPAQKNLLDLYRQLGVRQPPVISFLSRTNPLNQLLGRAKYRLLHLTQT